MKFWKPEAVVAYKAGEPMPGSYPAFDCPACIRADHAKCNKRKGPKYCACYQREHKGALAVPLSSRICVDCKQGDHIACQERGESFCDCKRYSLPEHESGLDEEVFV